MDTYLIYVVIDLAGVATGHGAYNIAHIGGALTGFIFVFSCAKERTGAPG